MTKIPERLPFTAGILLAVMCLGFASCESVPESLSIEVTSAAGRAGENVIGPVIQNVTTESATECWATPLRDTKSMDASSRAYRR